MPLIVDDLIARWRLRGAVAPEDHVPARSEPKGGARLRRRREEKARRLRRDERRARQSVRHGAPDAI